MSSPDRTWVILENGNAVLAENVVEIKIVCSNKLDGSYSVVLTLRQADQVQDPVLPQRYAVFLSDLTNDQAKQVVREFCRRDTEGECLDFTKDDLEDL